MTKKSRQKLKYLENEKSFWDEKKSIFNHFWRAFCCQKLPQTWEFAFKGLTINLLENLKSKSKLNNQSVIYLSPPKNVIQEFPLNCRGILSSYKPGQQPNIFPFWRWINTFFSICAKILHDKSYMANHSYNVS